MSHREPVTFFWFRRDLRLTDNVGLYRALTSGHYVVCGFIFDSEILDDLEDKRDGRVQFIRQELERLRRELRQCGSDIVVRYGKPRDIWRNWIEEFPIAQVHANRDYEPYARLRDDAIAALMGESGILFQTHKDQVIFDRDEVVKADGKPYTVYTPYSKLWRERLTTKDVTAFETEPLFDRLFRFEANEIPDLKDMGFIGFPCHYPQRIVDSNVLKRYGEKRDFPAEEGTSQLGIHLRFGTISIRDLTRGALKYSEPFLNELIWRNFYQVVMWHFPQTATEALKPKYDRIQWRNNPDEFEAWKQGRTGYPLVDAGMRQLAASGYMHNRIRMVTASFLTKHLLIDWRWGEAWFARKLLDFDLASNIGGWQWAAGSGADAAPYFRIFNPELQAEKFDPEGVYVRRWVPEWGSPDYPAPMVDHRRARERALEVYKRELGPKG